MKKTYYKKGLFEVTNEFVKARNRSIQISTLESVEMHRRLFHFALGLCACLALFGVIFGDLLYWYEVVLVLLIAAGALYLAWSVATLTIFSKLTGSRGWSVTWWFKDMQDMRAAIESSLEDRTLAYAGQMRHGGAVAAHGDGDDDNG